MVKKYMNPWELTKKQYHAFREEGIDWSNTRTGPGNWGKRKWRQRTIELHRDSIKAALARGVSVPTKVLNEYPDLKKKSKSISKSHRVSQVKEDTTQRRKYARGGRIEAYTFGEAL